MTAKLKSSPKPQQPSAAERGGIEGSGSATTFGQLDRTLSGPWLQKPLTALPSDSFLDKTVTSSPTSSIASYNALRDGANGQAPLSINGSNSGPGDHNQLNRHLTLFDLVCVGVGGTVGSGIFVLCGLIAHDYAGPATCLSWAISGLAACLSGCCYAELAGRIPSAGSSYAYVYASMGELPAVVAAACLSIEYTVSTSAVARSWGDKVAEWLMTELGAGHWVTRYLEPGYGFNPLAFAISAAAVLLLMNGVKESKSVTNFFTVTKVAVVTFMTVGGLVLMKRSNLEPFVPPQFGLAGVFRGSTSSFFGYLGYDEICCIAGEAINPRRNLPYAILLTLGGVTMLYISAAFALTGMQAYEDISGISGFPGAFHANGAHWAAEITAFGEVFTLPIVVVIGIMAQPRLQYALAQDGLIPPFFAKTDETGNLWNGTVVAGTVMITIATLVPFTHLNDMISAAVLVAFSMTNSSLVLLRHESPSGRPYLVEALLGIFNLSSFVTSVALTHFLDFPLGKAISVIGGFTIVLSILCLYRWCPQATFFGGRHRSQLTDSFTMEPKTHGDGYFRTPLLPFFPCMGIFVNWYLVSQLELIGIACLLAFLGIAAMYYFCYGAIHSVGNNGGWDNGLTTTDKIGTRTFQKGQSENYVGENDVLLRSVSLPRLAAEPYQHTA